MYMDESDLLSDEQLMNIDLYTIEGNAYRDIILTNSRLEYLKPLCIRYNIMYYSLLQSLNTELDRLPILHKKKIVSEYHKIIRN